MKIGGTHAFFWQIDNIFERKKIINAAHPFCKITFRNFVIPDALNLVGDPLTEKRVWFTESHTILIISFFTSCFIYSIYCLYKITERYIQ